MSEGISETSKIPDLSVVKSELNVESESETENDSSESESESIAGPATVTKMEVVEVKEEKEEPIVIPIACEASTSEANQPSPVQGLGQPRKTVVEPNDLPVASTSEVNQPTAGIRRSTRQPGAAKPFSPPMSKPKRPLKCYERKIKTTTPDLPTPSPPRDRGRPRKVTAKVVAPTTPLDDLPADMSRAMPGLRLLDIGHFVTQIRDEFHNNFMNCGFPDMAFVKEFSKQGVPAIRMKCSICQTVSDFTYRHPDFLP